MEEATLLGDVDLVPDVTPEQVVSVLNASRARGRRSGDDSSSGVDRLRRQRMRAVFTDPVLEARFARDGYVTIAALDAAEVAELRQRQRLIRRHSPRV